ncbi:MAG TPA: aldo/keto reductase [Ktedonobacteraceae bacterium]|jgi:aryl-alcohol dehydrogenase-like predicted oxidoreductase|nr:aldo/keto reductase [Ktedonobacteraceae bacterium]
MDYRKLGRTGLKVSALCLGTMQWGWTADEQAAFRVMDAFVENGGNFLDTADYYSRYVPGHTGGESEQIIGRWLATRRNRDAVILQTKVYQPMGERPNDRGLSRKHILEAVDASLRRLQTDYIDLYMAHAFDPETPIEETLETFNDLRRAGKIRYAGVSNFPAWRLVESLWKAEVLHTIRIDSLEPHYNLVHRQEFEQDLRTVCEKYQIAVTPYSSLANGFLTGKYRRGEQVQSPRASSVMKRYNREEAWRTIETVQRIAQEIGSTPQAVSLAWLMAQPTITAPIIGANSPEQLQGSLAALDVKLTGEQVEQLNEASRGL